MTEEDRISLRDYFEGRLTDIRRELSQDIAASREAVNKAEESLNRRLEGMNEFRDTLRDQASRLATKEAVDNKYDALELRVRLIENVISNLQGRLMVIGGVWAIVVVVVNYLIRTSLR